MFAKKSNNVINIISFISAVGIAIGTAALIIILSIYNGFQGLVADMYSEFESDLLITSQDSKFINNASELKTLVLEIPGVKDVSAILEDNVFINYDGRQGVALIKGVEDNYASCHNLEDCIVMGYWRLYDGEVPNAIVGHRLASKTIIRPGFLDPLEIYYPRRGKKISLLDPMTSLKTINVFPVGIINTGQQVDEQLIYLSINKAEELISKVGYVSKSDSDVTNNKKSPEIISSLEIFCNNNVDPEEIKVDIERVFTDRNLTYQVKDRYQQDETVYKMMKYEKIAIYAILLFIIIVISSNVFSSLSMLIIEKKDDIETLRDLGSPAKLLRRIFILEGSLITFWGMFIGLILGVVLSLIQQYYGVVAMPGNFIVDSYPIVVQVKDIILSAVAISVIGLVITYFPVRQIIK